MARRRNGSRQARALLELMAEAPRRWQYGYALSKQTGLKSGTVYPLLIRLAGQGLLASQWQPGDQPGRPPRHAYRLTASGLAFVRALAKRDQATARSASHHAATWERWM